MNKKSLLIIFTFLISIDIFSQKLTKKLFKSPEINSKKDSSYSSYTATAYFSGNGKKSVIVGSFVAVDLNSLFSIIQSYSNGSEITIDNVKYNNGNGQIITLDELPPNFENRLNIKKKKTRPSFDEIVALSYQNFVSGMIYFSGRSYSNTIVIDLTKNKNVKNYFDRLTSDDILVCEKCVYQNIDGSLSNPITKKYKIID